MKNLKATSSISRRQLLACATFAGANMAIPGLAAPLDAQEFGLVPNSADDQSQILQAAIAAAAKQRAPLFLPAGDFRVGAIRLLSNLNLFGVTGATRLIGITGSPIANAEAAENISLSGITFDGDGNGVADNFSALLSFWQCSNLAIEACAFENASSNGMLLGKVSGRVVDSRFSSISLTALHAVDSTGLRISGNTVSDCGNGGIRIFRNEAGYDGTIVTENRVSNIRSGSGNGQNGNCINAYLADDVIISDNVLSDCDFSAVRVNSTKNAIIKGNNCSDCREVAIFSEFAFSGSIIANNLIDGTAQGISITNLDSGGHLAVCTGNIVRNVYASSPTNPDTSPVGIFAEADTALTSNVIENVPGAGIVAGWGPFLRNVLIADNVVRDTDIGIVVSVAPDAGNVRVSNNMIAGARKRAIGAYRWTEPVGEDLAIKPDQFANVSVTGNIVS